MILSNVLYVPNICKYSALSGVLIKLIATFSLFYVWKVYKLIHIIKLNFIRMFLAIQSDPSRNLRQYPLRCWCDTDFLDFSRFFAVKV